MSQSKIIRIGWSIFYYVIARYLPVSYRYSILGQVAKACRAIACSYIFAKAGKNINIERGADFGSGTLIEIGNNSGIGINCSVPANLKMGNDVMMGPDVMIIGENHRFDDLQIPMNVQGFKETAPVNIGDDVWIGARVIILPGITIGRGSIIGAGAVVTKDVPPFTICAGNPAHVIRTRDKKSDTNLG